MKEVLFFDIIKQNDFVELNDNNIYSVDYIYDSKIFTEILISGNTYANVKTKIVRLSTIKYNETILFTMLDKHNILLSRPYDDNFYQPDSTQDRRVFR